VGEKREGGMVQIKKMDKNHKEMEMGRGAAKEKRRG